MTTYSKRYEVRVIGSRDDSTDTEILLQKLYETDDAADAKQQARKLGTYEYYGTAIVDRVTGQVDLGADENGQPLIVPSSRVRIEVGK